MYSLALLNIGFTLMIHVDLTTAPNVAFDCTRIPRTIVALYSYYPMLINAIIRDMQ